MLQSEFYERTGCHVSPEEFERIHENYMAFDGNKDEFCRAWKRANPATVKACRVAEKAAKEKACNDRKLWDLYNRLGKYTKPYSVKAADALTREGHELCKMFEIYTGQFAKVGDVRHDIYKYFNA